MLLEFKIIGERGYYANLNSREEENVFEHNGFRLAYYNVGGIIYAYYIGNYYTADLRGLNNVEEIDVITEIIAQCSDASKFDPVEID